MGTAGSTETAEIAEITTEAELREALGGHAKGLAVSKERYAPANYSRMLY